MQRTKLQEIPRPLEKTATEGKSRKLSIRSEVPSYSMVPEKRKRNVRHSRLFPKGIGTFTVMDVRDKVITFDHVTFAEQPRKQRHRRRKREQLRKQTQPF